MAIELDLDLHLGTGHRFAADRAGLSDPRTAEPTVGALRRKLSSSDRFAGLLSETGVVGDGFISGRNLEWASYFDRRRHDEPARPARSPRGLAGEQGPGPRASSP